jgi:hypothetical protein
MIKTCELQIGTSKSIVFDLFRDEIVGAFLVAATIHTASVFDLETTGEPIIGSPINLAFVGASNGKYRGNLAHDFSSWSNGDRIRIHTIMEEGLNHIEDDLIIVWKDRL